MERILVTVCVLWMGALAVTLFSVSRHRRGIQGGQGSLQGRRQRQARLC
jgi:hypothetical protein